MTLSLETATETLWVKLPAAAARFSPLLGQTLADGVYIADRPGFAVLLPVIAFVLGAAIVPLRDPYVGTYTGSLWEIGLGLLFGIAGAALGVWFWLGFVLTDFIGGTHPVGYSVPFPITFASYAITYALLWVLVVRLPFAADRLRRTTVPGSRRTGAVTALFHGLIQGVLLGAFVFAWTQCAAVLIRPLYIAVGQSPPIDAISPLQHEGWALAIVAAISAFVRVWILAGIRRSGKTRVAARAQSALVAAGTRPGRLVRVPRPLVVIVQMAASLLMLWGVLLTPAELLATCVALLGAFALREALAAVPLLVRAIRAIPTILRLAAVIALGYVVSAAVLHDPLGSNTFNDTFAPLLVSMGAALGLGSLLFPPAPRQRAI